MSNLDKGDLARSINGAYTILAADTDFIGASTPAEIAGAMGILAKAFLDTTAQLIEETGNLPSSSGAARGLPSTSPNGQSSTPSPPTSTPTAPTPVATGNGPRVYDETGNRKSAGGLRVSEKQDKFFDKLPGQAVKNSGSASYTRDPIEAADNYDTRQAIVDVLKAEAGYGPS